MWISWSWPRIAPLGFSGELEELAVIGAELRTGAVPNGRRCCRKLSGRRRDHGDLRARGTSTLAGMPRCRIVVRTGVGYDTLDRRGCHGSGGDGGQRTDYCIAEGGRSCAGADALPPARISELDGLVRNPGMGSPNQASVG